MRVTRLGETTGLLAFFLLVVGTVAASKEPCMPELVIGMGRLQQVELDPTGRFLATCSDSAFHIWRLDATCARSMPAVDGMPWAGFQWSPEGTMIALSDYRGRILILRASDLSTIAEIHHPEYSEPFPPSFCLQIQPMRIRWSPDGSRIAYGWWINTVDIFDISSQSLVASLNETDFGDEAARPRLQCPGDLDWSPDGSRILRTGWNGILVFDASSQKGLYKLGETNTTSLLFSLNPGVLASFSPDGTMIALWRSSPPPDTRTGSIRIYKAENGMLQTELKLNCSVAALAWLPGAHLALGTGEGRILVWALGDRKIVWDTPADNSSVLYLSCVGPLLASASGDGTVHVWTVSEGRLDQVARLSGWAPSAVGTVQWYPSGDSLAATYGPYGRGFGLTGSVRVYGLDGSEKFQVPVPWLLPGGLGLACISPGGDMIASSAMIGGGVSIWDALSGRLLTRLETGVGSILDLDWKPGERKLLAVSGENGVEIWDVSEARSEPSWRLEPGQDVDCLSWTPEGSALALGTASNIQIWDSRLQTMLANFSTGYPWLVNSLAWSPDGSELACLSYERAEQIPLGPEYCDLRQVASIWVWDLGQFLPGMGGPRLVGTFLVPHSDLGLPFCFHGSLAWSPNSTLLAVGVGSSELLKASDQELQRCSMLTKPGVEILKVAKDTCSGPYACDGLLPTLFLEGPARPVCSVSWSTDGSRIAAGSEDGCIRIWRVSPSTAVREALPIPICLLASLLCPFAPSLGKRHRPSAHSFPGPVSRG